MSTVASALTIAGSRQSGQPVRTQNGKLEEREFFWAGTIPLSARNISHTIARGDDIIHCKKFN